MERVKAMDDVYVYDTILKLSPFLFPPLNTHISARRKTVIRTMARPNPDRPNAIANGPHEQEPEKRPDKTMRRLPNVGPD